MADRVEHRPTEAELAVLLSSGVAAMPGPRFVMKHVCKPHTAAAEVDLAADPEQVRAHLRKLIGEGGGREIPDPNGAGDGSIWGVVPSGAGNLTTAMVRIEVLGVGGGSKALIRATGLEGLVKQKIGAKAVDRIAEALARG